jgi:acetate CoA/acetoacetate CoA-transferase alpha subunit
VPELGLAGHEGLKGDVVKDKIITLEALRSRFTDGMTVMVGGFMGVGAPPSLIATLIGSGARNLTLISSDTARVDSGVGPLIASGQVAKLYASHIGTNPETGRRMLSGELQVELVPQGTFAERIRCGGGGLGGVLTPTGIGTLVEEGKQKLAVNGREYLLETPLRADVALLKARRADRAGNLVYELSARNFNPLMALAADLVVAECDELVETGAIDPEHVVTPAATVDLIYCGAPA